MTKHTPGPWKVSRLRDEHHVITTDDDGYVIADAYGREKEPNGRLIAAAPDMLAALKDAQEEIRAWRRWAKPGEGPDKPAVTSFVLDKIAAAIAKAEGAA